MRTQFSKIVLAAFAVNSTLSMAFADIPKNCVEEITTLSKLSQTNDFDMQAFINNLPTAVAKAKLRAKSPFGQPKDSDIMDLGMTFGCLKDLPESPSEIASLFSEINHVETQPQYAQPQVQYVYVPQPDQPNQQKKISKNQRLIEDDEEKEEDDWTDNDERQERYYNIQYLINDGLKKNKKEIQKESLYLPYNDVQDLYNKNKKNARGCAALSGTVGFGVGSYIQGNKAFGITQTLLDGLGASFLIFVNNNVGGYTMVISRIAGLIVPFIYQQSYNKALAEALNNNYFHFSYSIDPLIVPKDGGAPAVGLAFNLRY